MDKEPKTCENCHKANTQELIVSAPNEHGALALVKHVRMWFCERCNTYVIKGKKFKYLYQPDEK